MQSNALTTTDTLINSWSSALELYLVCSVRLFFMHICISLCRYICLLPFISLFSSSLHQWWGEMKTLPMKKAVIILYLCLKHLRVTDDFCNTWVDTELISSFRQGQFCSCHYSRFSIKLYGNLFVYIYIFKCITAFQHTVSTQNKSPP